MKLNLGCGKGRIPGYVNVDLHGEPDLKCDARALPYRDQADEIIAKHLFEHFGEHEALGVLDHWKKVLRVGGKLVLIVPDMEAAVELMRENPRKALDGDNIFATPYRMIYGASWEPGGSHLAGWDKDSLSGILEYAGFSDVVVEKTVDQWCPILYATAIRPESDIGPVDIIIPCWNQAKYTERLLRSLEQTEHPFRCILVDNGSEDHTERVMREFQRRFPDTVIIRLPENIGYVKAINRGLEAVENPYVMFCNNDVEIVDGDKKWLRRMVDHFIGRVGAVGPTSGYVFGFQKNNFSGFPLHHRTSVLSGFCVLYKKSVVDEIGPLDERFGFGGNDDLDYSIRLENADYHQIIARDVFVEHKGSVSLLVYTKEKYGAEEEDHRMVDWLDQETRAVLEEKWGKERVQELFASFAWFVPIGTERMS